MQDKSRYVCPEYISLREVNDLDNNPPTSSFGDGYQAYCDANDPRHVIHSAAIVMRAVGVRRPDAANPTIIRVNW